MYYFVLLVFNVREAASEPVARTSINACKSNNNSWNLQIFKEFYH